MEQKSVRMTNKLKEQMQYLLEQEGLKIVDDKVSDPTKSFWDPSKELI